ncbi:MAG: hypothetical protein ABW123_01915 [Cystobacter sp.]
MRTYSPCVGRTFAALLTVFLLTAPTACRKPAQPSEAYVEAQTRFGKLYAAKGDDAFLDAEVSAIEALLDQVPARSLDAEAARELRTRIENGRSQARSRQRSLDEVRTQASTPAAPPAAGYEQDRAYASPPPSSEPEPVEDEAPDAGTDAGTSDAPGVGTSARELANGFYGCFQQGQSLQVMGRGMRDRWELKDSASCRQRFPSLQEQVFLIEDGKVLGLAPKKDIQAMSPDGGPQAPPGR